MGDSRFYTYTQLFSVMLMVVLTITVVAITVFYYYRIEKKRSLYLSLSISLIALLFLYVFSLVAASEYISSYSFNILIIISVIHILFAIYVLIQFKDMGRKVSKKFVYLLIILYLSSLIFFYRQVYANLAVFIYTLNFIFLSSRVINYRVSPAIFYAVKRSLPNYVFIISAKGHLIYQNDEVLHSGIFKELLVVDFEDIDSMFNAKSVIETIYDEKVYCFKEYSEKLTLIKKEIYSNNELAYVIMTFSDVSKLLDLLYELEKQRETVFMANIELERYKDRVYELEKTREISTLLDDVAKNQYRSMDELKERISMLDKEGDDFLQRLSHIINLAQKDLKDVRKVVSMYRK